MPIHPTAVICPAAEIAPSAEVGPYVIVDGPVRVGPDCRIASHAVLIGATSIDAGCRIHSHAVIGDLPQDRAFAGDDSGVEIGPECVIREGVTIHRGTGAGSRTVIGPRCLLMTNAHVGHNCVLSEEVTLISGALLGGYVEVGAGAVISGNAAVHQFVRIGELAMISGLGKIVQDIPPFFMTDREGALVGVNRVGLLRSGFSSLERAELKNAFRIVYRSGMGRDEALKVLEVSITTEPGRRLMTFLRSPSRRGIAGGSRREESRPPDPEHPLRAAIRTE
jgi:UDP-N-acetylglucosamine acyltransferase